MSPHEHEPKLSGLEEIQARRAAFAQKLSEMSVMACDDDGNPAAEHKEIVFPKPKLNRQYGGYYDTTHDGEW